MKHLTYLKLSRPISMGDYVTDTIGPFESTKEAYAYYEAHEAKWTLLNVAVVTVCSMVQPCK